MTNETTEPNELLTEKTFDLYQVLWHEDYESSRTIAIVKTEQEARNVIAEHVKNKPHPYGRLYYEIDGWNIGDVRPCY